MATKGFDISGFRMPPVEREFLPHEDVQPGDGVKLLLNLDLLTLERMELIDEEFRAMFDEKVEPETEELETSQALAITEPTSKSKKLPVAGKKPEKKKPSPTSAISLYAYERAVIPFRAKLLAGQPGEDDPDKRIIRSWNVVKNGKAMPVCYESLIVMPSQALEKLYLFCTREANNPTKDEKKE